MYEVVIAAAALVAGAVIGWLWRGKRLYEGVAKLGEHWVHVGDKLSKAVDAYVSATSTLESRVLVSARRLRELKAAPERVEIEVIEPVERTVRGYWRWSFRCYRQTEMSDELRRVLQAGDMYRGTAKRV
ncbi:MAG TPA: DNA recombination protein RmuC [Burkholderiales bacterium]|nr:DNA recombination protein RmuC [Burkholderiales bacterium]